MFKQYYKITSTVKKQQIPRLGYTYLMRTISSQNKPAKTIGH